MAVPVATIRTRSRLLSANDSETGTTWPPPEKKQKIFKINPDQVLKIMSEISLPR